MTHAANWKSLERHPLSAEYADITGKAWELYLSNLQAVGNVNGRKVVLHEGKVLDGWQFQRACVELDSKPEYEKLPAGVDPAAWVSTLNDHRRHESQDKATRRIEERRERVAAARVEGKSLRAIAEQEGVAVGTVASDLAEVSTVQGRTVEPKDGKVQCKGGRVQTANPVQPPKPEPVLCARCTRNERTGQPVVKGCKDCKAERSLVAKQEKARAAPVVQAEPGEDHQADQEQGGKLTDAEGEIVPDQAVRAFEAADQIEALCKEIGSLLKRAVELAKGPGGRCIRIESVKQQLTDAKSNLWANRPTHVCPYCKGKKDKCDPCKGEGWVPKHVYVAAPGINEKSKRA